MVTPASRLFSTCWRVQVSQVWGTRCAGCAGLWPQQLTMACHAPGNQGDAPMGWGTSIDMANPSWDDGWPRGMDGVVSEVGAVPSWRWKGEAWSRERRGTGGEVGVGVVTCGGGRIGRVSSWRWTVSSHLWLYPSRRLVPGEPGCMSALPSDAVQVSVMGQLVGTILNGRGAYQMAPPKVRVAAPAETLDGARARRG